MATQKPGHYTEVLRQVNELKRQLHLVEAERKACEDEGNETIKKNQQRLNRLKQDVSDLKSELSEAVKNSRSVGGHQLGIVQLLSDNGIDASKYRTSRSVDDIMADLDCRIADIVKQADLSKYQTQKIYQRINEMDEQLKLEAMAAAAVAASMSSSVQEDQQSAVGAGGSTSGHHRSPVKSPSNNDSLVKQMGHEAAMTEIQSVRQKVAEAYHIQRQYKTILDVLATERIGHESQLQDLEKNIADLKAEIVKLKEVRESARRARDVAKNELHHHEESLVASTRETDRLLSEYKRRIDEMKSTSNLGPGTSNRRASSYQQQAAPQLMSTRGLNHATTTSGGGGGGPSGVVSPSTAAAAAASAASQSISPSTAAAAAGGGGGGGDGLNDQDVERASLHERKQAIDHLKSVTGATDIRSAIHIIESQREKCDELRQQFGVLQERQSYLTTLNETLQARLNELAEPAPPVTPSNDADVTPRMTLIDQMFDRDGGGGGGSSAADYNPLSTSIPAGSEEDYEGALSSVTTVLAKLCTQIPVGPAFDETLTQPTSMAQQIEVLNLLEKKLMALVELVKATTSTAAATSSTPPRMHKSIEASVSQDLLFSTQVSQLSLPSTPRLLGTESSASIAAAGMDAATIAAAAAASDMRSTDRSRSPSQHLIQQPSPSTTNKMRLLNNESMSDDDQVPTRGFLKRQTRIIVEAKTKKQNQRPRKGE